MVKTALAFADDDDAALQRRIRERLLLLDLDKRYPCTILDGLLPQGWESDPLCEAERALVERVSRDLFGEDGIVLAVHTDDEVHGPGLMLSKIPADEPAQLGVPGLVDDGLAAVLARLPQPHREQVRQIAAQALDQLNRGQTPTLSATPLPPPGAPTPLRDADGVRLDQAAAWHRLVAAAELYRGVWDELRSACIQARAAGVDDDVLRAWMSAAIGRAAMLYVTADLHDGHGTAAKAHPDQRDRVAAQAQLDEQIADLKARLADLNPVHDAEKYNRLFGDLVELEQRRRR
ncbi:hypothetical protein GCM10010411_75650 [Actinomadura fulvescens]|uniref:Uncharacterized protein n=1 Tax=Actinomadura fulvescens TaxID=46160 RepID=A0ABN3QIJ2_9ACTN